MKTDRLATLSASGIPDLSIEVAAGGGEMGSTTGPARIAPGP